MAEEEELDLDIAELESFLDNFDISKTNELLLVNEDSSNNVFKSVDNHSESSSSKTTIKLDHNAAPFVPKLKSIKDAKNQVEQVLSINQMVGSNPLFIHPSLISQDSIVQDYGLHVQSNVQNSVPIVKNLIPGSDVSKEKENTVPEQMKVPGPPFEKVLPEISDSQSSFTNPLFPPEPQAKNNFKNPLTKTPSPESTPKQIKANSFSNPLFNSASNTPKKPIDQIQFKISDLDSVSTALNPVQQDSKIDQESNLTPKKSNLRSTSKEDSISCASVSSEKSTVRVRMKKSNV